MGETALHRIDTAPVVYVSAISGFEIGIKVQKGKLHLPVPPTDWFAAVLAHHHLEVLALDLDVCLRSTALPAIHADPCDRMIIAAAQLSHLPVITMDPLFAQYGIEVMPSGPGVLSGPAARKEGLSCSCSLE